MAYIVNYGNNILDLFQAAESTLTGAGWSEIPMAKDQNQVTDAAIFVGSGGGNDKIYIYLSCHDVDGSTVNKLILDSSVGYDPLLGVFEQPGSIQQWLKATGKTQSDTPTFTISTNERFFYWIFVDNYRIIIVARMSIMYESMYLGFLNPIASERQYPYPMYVCGNSHFKGQDWPNNQNGSFVFPIDGAGWLRRADGTWRKFNASKPDPSASTDGTVFPYNSHNKKLIPNYKEINAVNQDNFLLIPIMLQTNNPVDMNGLLRGCYWVSGTRDIDSERLLSYNGEQYIVFDTKEDRGANTYFAIKMV